MSRITYLTGDATQPKSDGVIFIAHCLSDTGAHDAGFAKTVGEKWPKAKRAYQAAVIAGEIDAGECLPAWVEPGLCIIAMIGQQGLGRTSLRHNWLGAALHNLAANAIKYDASVHMPRIGCGLAGGKWEEVEPLVLCAFNVPLASFVPVFVYDLPAK